MSYQIGSGHITSYHIISFEGVCLTSVILAPGASEVGLGAAALAPLWRDNSLPRGPRLNSVRSFFMCRHRKRSKY